NSLPRIDVDLEAFSDRRRKARLLDCNLVLSNLDVVKEIISVVVGRGDRLNPGRDIKEGHFGVGDHGGRVVANRAKHDGSLELSEQRKAEAKKGANRPQKTIHSSPL